MEDKEKKQKMMRFWLVGTFIILFASATAYLYLLPVGGTEILGSWQYWAGMVGAAVLFWGTSVVYNRMSDK